MTSIELSAGELCKTIETYTGDTDKTNALIHVNAGYRRFLNGLDLRGAPTLRPRKHFWSFLRAVDQLTLSGPISGTATSVAGAVTATTDIFNESVVGLDVVVTDYDGAGNDLTTQISGYTDADQITVEATDNWAAKAIEVEACGIYDLPSDFGGFIRKPVYYSHDDDTPELREASPEDIFRMWRDDDSPEEARRWAVTSKAFVAATGERFQLLIAPRPDESRVILYRYTRIPDRLTDSTAVYLIGGGMFSEAIKYCCLAEAEFATGRTAGVMAARADKELSAAIDVDANALVTRASGDHMDYDSGPFYSWPRHS